MDWDFGEKKFRSGNPVVVCEYIATQFQNVTDLFVKRAIPYGYILVNVATNQVDGFGMNGTKYIMTFHRTIKSKTIEATEEPELDAEIENLLKSEPDVDSVFKELEELKPVDNFNEYRKTLTALVNIIGVVFLQSKWDKVVMFQERLIDALEIDKQLFENKLQKEERNILKSYIESAKQQLKAAKDLRDMNFKPSRELLREYVTKMLHEGKTVE